MPEIITREFLHRGWNNFSLARIKLDDGQIISRAIEDHGSAICVLPYDPVRRMAILVRQFRAPVFAAAGQADLLEAIAGLIDDEAPQDTARREAMEEAGLRLAALEPVSRVWSIPGSSTERIELFLAAYDAQDRVGDGGGLAHEHENITVEERPLDELARMADAGEIDDLKTLALVQTLRLRHPALFA